ncbi:MAG: dTDP-glucose 4,6-dehydratase [Betaproteobacteria bacterium]|nr:dTDP-glucose 4,6-dehydratase [Betaproteobacteria bacterium]
MILVTGGAGFIGSNFVLDWLAAHDEPVVNLDKLTYAGNLRSLAGLAGDARHIFVRGDIGDADVVSALLERHRPRAIVNLAAETHVDRSIRSPRAFVDANVVGTFTLLECVRTWWQTLPAGERAAFRFLHVSTDEVYGSLGLADPAFSEATPFAPNSPYAASKAASDHLVRAWHHTYGLPTLTTNCSNNYGPRQFPEKLIPLMIVNALAGKPLPVYGDGQNVRDWLYVGDHCSAIRAVLARGRPGETYNVGGNAETRNIDVVRTLCRLLAARVPGRDFTAQVTFVADRPGHDRRYAIDATKIRGELGWAPAETFESGMAKAVDWYLGNGDWLASVQSEEYRRWIDLQYA